MNAGSELNFDYLFVNNDRQFLEDARALGAVVGEPVAAEHQSTAPSAHMTGAEILKFQVAAIVAGAVVLVKFVLKLVRDRGCLVDLSGRKATIRKLSVPTGGILIIKDHTGKAHHYHYTQQQLDDPNHQSEVEKVLNPFINQYKQH